MTASSVQQRVGMMTCRIRGKNATVTVNQTMPFVRWRHNLNVSVVSRTQKKPKEEWRKTTRPKKAGNANANQNAEMEMSGKLISNHILMAGMKIAGDNLGKMRGCRVWKR